MTIIETIRQTIHQDCLLKRKDRDWQIGESPLVNLRAPHRHSIGFSLDNRAKEPFPFFSSQPPAGLVKMCDAIIALPYKETLYLFLVEQKTAHKDDYKKQLVNGALFCNWLFSLYKYHGYINVKPVLIGLLIRQPRQKAPRKGTTAHRRGREPKTCPLLQRLFEVNNENCIALAEFIDNNWEQIRP